MIGVIGDVMEPVHVAVDSAVRIYSDVHMGMHVTLASKGGTDWFTADPHAGHANIISFCHRPFSSAEEMDNALVERWNSVVRAMDRVYIVGDVTLGSDAPSYLTRLNGQIFIVPSLDHDVRWLGSWGILGTRIVVMPPLVTKSYGGQYAINGRDMMVTLCHYPLESWPASHYTTKDSLGSIHLHGHRHGLGGRVLGRLDVGVDAWNGYPVSLDEAIGAIRECKPYPGWKVE